MALSDEERQRLEQLEALLAEDDPKLAHTLRGEGPRGARPTGRAALVSGIGFVLGIGLLVAGMQWHWTICIVGFVVMLAAAAHLVASRRDGGSTHRSGLDDVPRAPSRQRSSAGSGRRRTPSNAAFMDRLEERWRRRQEEGR